MTLCYRMYLYWELGLDILYMLAFFQEVSLYGPDCQVHLYLQGANRVA